MPAPIPKLAHACTDSSDEEKKTAMRRMLQAAARLKLCPHETLEVIAVSTTTLCACLGIPVAILHAIIDDAYNAIRAQNLPERVADLNRAGEN